MRQLNVLFGLAASALLALAPPALSDSRKSVVRVTCILENGGQMKATGFIWPDKGQMVTALHAVAGCKQVEVYSQNAKKSTVATKLISVDLEADLALLQLEQDLGLAPVPHAVQEPDLRDRFMAWGYPLVQKRIVGHKIEFGFGMDSNITTIGQAFEGDEIKELFRSQSYPGKKTKILRVTSTIQPGHSGAPIFDENGNVVAIADGGLLGGFKGVNWSIPAHIYLTGLPQSSDPIPDEVSSWAGLFSATQPGSNSGSSQVFESAAQADPDVAQGDPELTDTYASVDEYGGPQYLGEPELWLGDGDGPFLLRQVTLREALDYMFYTFPDSYFGQRILELAWDDALFDQIWYNVYQDPVTGAQVAFPGWLGLEWNAEYSFIRAYTADRAYEMTGYFRQGNNFNETYDNLYYQAEWMDGFVQWSSLTPTQSLEPTFDEVDQTASASGWNNGYDPSTGQYVTYYSSGNVYGTSFRGVTARYPTVEPGTDQAAEFNAHVMEAGMVFLSDIYPIEDFAWAFDQALYAEAGMADGSLAGTGADNGLTLVRQMNLRQALDYMRYLDEEEPLIASIEEMLWDEELKDQIWFNVYEDSLTGATVAVPDWVAMSWNNDTGELIATNAAGSLELAISVVPGEGFNGAMEQVGYHVEALAAQAEWYDLNPANYDWTYFWPDENYAEFSGFFEGYHYFKERQNTTLMNLYVSGDVFMGTTVTMTPEGEFASDDEVLEAMMMEVSARYLSDFASF